MRRIIMGCLVGILAMGVGVGCKPKEIAQAPAAKVKEPTKETPKEEPKKEEAKKEDAKPDAAAAPGKELAVKGEPDSKLGWVGGKASGDTHEGGFKTFTGKVTLGEDGKVSAISFDVDTTSVYSDVDKLTTHLKSKDFFEVEAHPKATFASTAIKEKAEGENTHEVTGNMTIRGITKELTFPAKITVADGKVEATSTFKMERTQFGIVYKGQADNLIDNEVVLKLKLVAEAPKG